MKFTISINDMRFFKELDYSKMEVAPKIKIDVEKKIAHFKIEEKDEIEFERAFMYFLTSPNLV